MNILLQRILCNDPLGRRCHKLRTEGLQGGIFYKRYFLSAILLLQTACHMARPCFLHTVSMDIPEITPLCEIGSDHM